jgi:hypothetical protein
MPTHSPRAALALIVLAALPLASPALPTTASVSIAWDPTDVRVSAGGLYAGDVQGVYEPSVSIDPTHPLRMVATAWDLSSENVGGEYSTNRDFLTEDGGITWTSVGPTTSMFDQPDDSGDPVLVHDARGHAYKVSLVDPSDEWRYLLVLRSEDGGAHWDAPAVAHRPWRDAATDTCFSVDKPWLSLGAHEGELLLTYSGAEFMCSVADSDALRSLGMDGGTLRRFGTDVVSEKDLGIYLRRSFDDGRTWSEQVKVSEGSAFSMQSAPHAAPDGTIHVAYWQAALEPLSPCPSAFGVLLTRASGGSPFAHVVVATSHDDGATWSHHHQGTCHFELDPDGMTDDVNSFTVDPSTGDAYDAYLDWLPVEQRYDARMIASHDGGLTWSAPVAPLSGSDTHHLVALVARDGALFLAYLAPERATGQTAAFLVTSVDEGVTWSAPTELSTQPGAGGGDYIGLDAAGGRIVAMWTDQRSGVGEIWARAGTIT